ncbi:MAG: hypothetical protein Q4C78_04750 [Synergistaceae bacterium]|nr:hypothetical protein [Synergistaceae bacterium]
MIGGKGITRQQMIVRPSPVVVKEEIEVKPETKPVKKTTFSFSNLFTKSNPYVMKLVIYKDCDMTEIASEEVITGAVEEQIAQVQKRIAEISKESYPKEALQEVLWNAVAHRNYQLKGATLVNVTDEEIAVMSLGGLTSGLLIDDIEAGASVTPNEELAIRLKEKGLVQLCGTGLRRVKSLYKDYRLIPQFYATQNVFVAVLPSTKALEKKKQEGRLTPAQRQEDVVVGFLLEHGTATEADLQKLLATRRTRTYLITKAMTDAGIIEKIGLGKNKKYRLAKK